MCPETCSFLPLFSKVKKGSKSIIKEDPITYAAMETIVKRYVLIKRVPSIVIPIAIRTPVFESPAFQVEL